ncbi:hypothetical protein ECNE1487_2314, partial [Escherichia coli NE1487]
MVLTVPRALSRIHR